METASRARIAQVVLSTVLAGGLTLGGLACGGSQSPPPGPQADLQPPAPAQPPAMRLPSNAPVAASPTPGISPAPTAGPSPAGATAQPAAPTPAARAAPTAATPGGPALAAPAQPTVATAVPRSATPPSPPQAQQPQVNIPVGAEWTIYCYAVKGPTHGEDSAALKASLIRKTGQPDWYVIHGTDESKVYFGFFKSVLASDRKNEAEVARAEAALKSVKELKDLAGNNPFAKAVFVSLEAPDPTAANDLNLYNVDRALAPKNPKRAYWSLQIAAFRADPRRKEAAVEMVKDLRAQGVDAYYYHGESISSVCVGRWPATALKAQNRRDDIKDQAVNANNGNLTVSGVPLEDLEKLDGMKIQKAKSIDNKDTVTVAPKLEVLDPTLAATMQKFPHHAVNYEEGKQLSDGRVIYNPSFLVVIPRAPGNGLYDSDDAEADPIAGGRGRIPPANPAAGMTAPRERVLGADASRGYRNGQ